MSVYLDASALVSLFLTDAFSTRADRLLRSMGETLYVTDFGAAEFASGISRHVRDRRIEARHARMAFSEFDEWSSRDTTSIKIIGDDIAVAANFMRRLDSALRTPDAIHIAVARRIGSRLLTFDKKMVRAAKSLGLDVLD